MGTLPLIETEMTVSLICILVFSALVAAHRPPSTCLTVLYNQCKFPFRYRGRLFNECTTYNSENGEAWCATRSGQYEDCQSSCPGVRPLPPYVCYDSGIKRREGESWKKDCNTCTCNNGYVACTEKACYNDHSLCTCINPFRGLDSHIGDPDVTCSRRKQPFCYVECNSDCRDLRPAKGGGRCYSRVACDTSIPAYDPRLGG